MGRILVKLLRGIIDHLCLLNSILGTSVVFQELESISTREEFDAN